MAIGMYVFWRHAFVAVTANYFVALNFIRILTSGAVVSSARMGNAKGARGPREEKKQDFFLDFSSCGPLAIALSLNALK